MRTSPPRNTAAASVLADLESEDRDRTVRQAVLALPARYRDATILFYFHGMDIRAAATTLGLPEGTVKTRRARARELLGSKLRRLLAAAPLEHASR